MYTQRPSAFAYARPSSVDEAVALLADNEDARPLAGGHSLLPAMKLRLSAPSTLVDLGGIDGLDDIAREDGGVRVGALVTHEMLSESELVQAICPLMAETAGMVGDRQVRHRGTIGGSLAAADPGADYPTVVKALGATVNVTGPDGERSIEADEFFVSLFTTALQPGEIVTSVRLPAMAAGTGGAYLKHRHPASRYAVVGVAAVVAVEAGTCHRARIVVGGATGSPVDVRPAEQAIAGQPVSADGIAAAAGYVPEAVAGGLGDHYASAEYRAHLAGVMARRALEQAVERATAT